MVYWATVIAGVGVLTAVAAAPALQVGGPAGWLLAHDPVTRRAAVVCGVGLLATARAFFRWPHAGEPAGDACQLSPVEAARAVSRGRRE